MSRERDWAVFEKACEITASAVRGTMGGEGGQPPSFVSEVFREVHATLRSEIDELPATGSKAGF